MKRVIILVLIIFLLMGSVASARYSEITWTHKAAGCSTLNISPTLFGEIKISRTFLGQDRYDYYYPPPVVGIKGYRTYWIDRWFYKGHMYYDFKITGLKKGHTYWLIYNTGRKKVKM